MTFNNKRIVNLGVTFQIFKNLVTQKLVYE